MKKVETKTVQDKSFERKITFFIVLIALLIRVIRLDIPHDWSFDEVYHALSAEAYALNDPRGYEWWNESPKDLAYEWLHPPVSKLFMAASIKMFAKPYVPESKSAPVDGKTSFAWRFPGTIFAALTVWLLIIFGQKLFKNYWIGAVAGGLYALDGLSFVQSRTGMNDIYITFFVVFAFYRLFIFLTEYPARKLKNLWWLGIASGLAASTKWTGFYAVGMVFIWGTLFALRRRGVAFLSWVLLVTGMIFYKLDNFSLAYDQLVQTIGPWVLVGVVGGLVILIINNRRKMEAMWIVVCLGLVPVLVYLLSYSQWWLQGHSLNKFYELHQQIWWYQTGLKATHDYQSQALTWPILYRPVWFYVKYQDVVKNGQKVLYIGNIYTMGHPLIWWAGLVGILNMTWLFIKKGISWLKVVKNAQARQEILPYGIILVGYFSMFLPWILSPRIMFLYHYLPSVPFLCLALAYGLWQIKQNSQFGKYAVTAYLTLVVLVFIYFYPHWSALPLPENWVNKYYWLPSWK